MLFGSVLHTRGFGSGAGAWAVGNEGNTHGYGRFWSSRVAFRDHSLAVFI